MFIFFKLPLRFPLKIYIFFRFSSHEEQDYDQLFDNLHLRQSYLAYQSILGPEIQELFQFQRPPYARDVLQ